MAQPSFEKDLEQLEAVVVALEAGGLSLDDALKRFEEGIKLARRCDKALSDAEKKIELLVKNTDGNVEPRPFEGAETSETTPESAPGKQPASSAAPAAENGAPSGEEGEEGELLF